MKLFNSLFALLRQHKKTLLLILIVSTATILISSAISIWLSNFHNLTLPTIGTIKTIGVEAYWDPNCENKTETIDWDTVWPGSTKNVTLYIRSVSNVKTALHLNTSNITPSNISEYLNLSWNYDGTPLNPDGIIPVTLFLSASSDKSFSRYLIANNVTDFSIDIHVVAYE
ncbi:MAG: hypothetical protein D4S01_00415 [Dehalococcoidia bacterium]|nr:MAG: hypothetical protein D4S01_00415 [Dehalococcoidia bacterium]